jgi:hypothetical protein
VRGAACLDDIEEGAEGEECNEKIIFLFENRWSGKEVKKLF